MKQLALLIILFLPTSSYSAQKISWSDLAPPGNSSYEKLYNSFNEEDKGLTGWIFFMEANRPEEIDPEDADLVLMLKQAKEYLQQEKGLDLQEYAKAKKKSDNRVNKELLDTDIEIEGVLVGTTEPGTAVLLSRPWQPQHETPPTPNQIIVVKIMNNQDVTAFTPVTVSGNLLTQKKEVDLVIEEPPSQLTAAYELTHATIMEKR